MPFHGSDRQGHAFLQAMQWFGGVATTAQLRPEMKARYGDEDVRNGAASLRKLAWGALGVPHEINPVECEYLRRYEDRDGRWRLIYRYTLCEQLGGPPAEPEPLSGDAEANVETVQSRFFER